MKVIILAAGQGSRLNPITLVKPKCMVKVGGRPVLDHQIRACAAAGIKDIIVVAGYKIDQVKEYCDKIKEVDIKIIENKDYKTTNNMYSLYLAKEEVVGNDFLLSNGDVVFDPRIVNELLHNKITDVIVSDKDSYNEESMKITTDASGYINDISKEISPSVAYGNSIDMYIFSPKSSAILFEEISKIIEEEKDVNDWVEVALQRLLKGGRLKMRPFDIGKKRWVEIDDYTDLALADKLFCRIESLKSKKIFFIDLDGTIYLDDEPINGAREFIAKLRNLNKHIYFLSNNSSKSKASYIKKLRSMGIKAREEELILSTDGVIEFLLKERVKDVFVVGTKSMRQAFKNAGFNISSNDPKYVVLGYDTELTYSKIRQAALLLQNGVNLIATHCDMVCPTIEGPIPDIGSILALFQAATGKIPVKVFGKPNPEMVSHIMERHHARKEEVIIIGDRLYTDMELARRIGCDFICTLSGETHREDIENIEDHPDLVVRNIGELMDYFTS